MRVYYLKQLAQGKVGLQKGGGKESGRAGWNRRATERRENRPTKSTARGERGENICSFTRSNTARSCHLRPVFFPFSSFFLYRVRVLA